MRTPSQRIAENAVKDMRELWGGRLPTWDEFKKANNQGRVRVNKDLANNLILMRRASGGVSKAYILVFGSVILWVAFLVSPIAIALYFLIGISGWWILGSLGLAWYLIKVARKGQCNALRIGAEADEQFYLALINHGAFLFGPVQNQPRETSPL